MPPARMRGDGRKAKDPKKTLLRLLKYMLPHAPKLVLVFGCIILTAVAQTRSTTAIGTLVDDHLLPMLKAGSTDLAPLIKFLGSVAAILVVGILSSFLHSFLMAGISQKIQKTIRDEMFFKMQRLPLRYFDSNAAGNIMSRYTSDIDTMQQVLSQSLPQCVSAVATLTVVLINMIKTSWILTGVCMVTVVGVVFSTRYLGGKAGKYFMGQQKSLGAVNGYIEEMVNGQKVVKVFNHEQVCKDEFDKLNEELCHNA